MQNFNACPKKNSLYKSLISRICMYYLGTTLCKNDKQLIELYRGEQLDFLLTVIQNTGELQVCYSNFIGPPYMTEETS